MIIVAADEQYGSWTVLEDATRVDQPVLAECRCGTLRKVRSVDLVLGKSKSCGDGICSSQYRDGRRVGEHGPPRRRHLERDDAA